MKVNLIYHPGCPTVRMQMARKFADLDGFRVLLSLLRNPNIQWMGAESLQIILKSMTEVKAVYIHVLHQHKRIC